MSRERQPFETLAITIATSTTVSSPFESAGWHITSITTPSAWTDGDLSIEVDPSGLGTWYPVVDSAGDPIVITGIATGTAENHLMPAALDTPFLTAQAVRFVSAVEQEANRTLIVTIAPNE